MSHTYATNIVHCLFSTKERAPLISDSMRQQVGAYLSGILSNIRVPLLAIGGIADHVHVLIALPPTHSLAKVICDLKANSSRWLNENGTRFAWQEGYAAFSVSPSRIEAVQHYIRAQAQHHQKKNYHEEFLELLRRSGISLDEHALVEPLTGLGRGQPAFPALTR